MQRVGTVARDCSDTHIDSEFLLPEPIADARHVVLVQEGESV